MNYKKLIFYLFINLLILNSFVSVKAETLAEKISNLSSKVSELAENVTSIDTSIDSIYPIGSIYISYNSTNPASLFGGTWEIYSSGKHIVGAGNNGTTTYTASNTAGNATITLATTNLPAHTHTLTPSGTVSSTFTGSQVTTSSAGAHTHYLSWASVADTGEGSGYGLGSGYTYWQNKVMVTGGSITLSSSTFSTSTHTVTPAGTVTSTFTGTSVTSSSVGSNSSLNIENPYITVYMWKRTA